MIALVRPDDGPGPGGQQDRIARAFRDGAARARGGALPSAASLHALLDGVHPAEAAPELDALLADRDERTPPVLKAALAARLLCVAPDAGVLSTGFDVAHVASLAVTFVLCVGGATTDAWLTLPRRAAAAGADGAGPSLRETFSALARDARAAERGLQAALELCDTDAARVRAALGRAAYSALDLLALLRDRIVISIPDAARTLGLTPPTAGAAVARLVELGIAREVTGKARSRAFVYDGIVGALAPASAT